MPDLRSPGTIALGLYCLTRLCGAAQADPDAAGAGEGTIQVTGTRIAAPVQDLPASLTTVEGSELRARGVRDLAGALALAAGIEAPPGGDAGPASAVPSLWGLSEFDAFLLVVDGVPWGGAFNPAIPALDLTNVERIEVLRGSAPVLFGATSFVGVIQVIHYPAGRSADDGELAYGSFGSGYASASKALSGAGLRQSLSVEAGRRAYSDPRESVRDGRFAWRAGTTAAGGELDIDVDAGTVHQKPASPVVRQGGALTVVTGLDANFNPADARIDEDRAHLALRYARPASLGTWSSVISVAQTGVADIRGFLRPDLVNNGTPNADSQNQYRTILDGYADTHVATALGERLQLVWGADALFGLGRQRSVNGAYFAPLASAAFLPATTALHVDEINSLSDRRVFLGQYLQCAYAPVPGAHVVAGLRLNETRESLASSHFDGFDAANSLAGYDSRRVLRASGSLGVSLRLWNQGGSQANAYIDMRSAFKPAALDFGPDYRPGVLDPETARSFEAGIKGDVDSRLHYEASLFTLDFHDLVVTTTDSQGNPLVQNAGSERLRGVEADARYLLAGLVVQASASVHDARFRQYVATEGGANIDAAGKRLPLSARTLAAFGIQTAPGAGLGGALVLRSVGARFLDIANAAKVPGYTTMDVNFGYDAGPYRIGLDAINITNRRPPVSASEFGDRSYYLLAGRVAYLRLTVGL